MKLYEYFSDSEGKVQIPRPFQSCKKMSFQDFGVPTLLVSRPGSGNSWVRQLLETTTGIYTGGVDCDPDYIKAGMLGEGISSENVITIKFHMEPPEFYFKKAIYIIRNPYKSFVADYNRHVLTAKDPNQAPHLSQADISNFGEAI